MKGMVAIFGTLIGIGLLFFGGLRLYESSTAGEIEDITMAELVEGGPATGWYRISGAQWNELQALYHEEAVSRRIQSDGMMTFVQSEGADPSEPVQVVMTQDSYAIAGRIDEARQLDERIALGEAYLSERDAAGEQVDEAQLADAIAALDELEALEAEHARSGTIEGRVSDRMPSGWTRAEAMRLGGDSLAEDFMVVEQGWQPPESGPAWIMIGIGLVCLLLGIWAFIPGRRRHDREEWA